ncbi:MAG: SLBB domain-containing protein, partial [Chromatiales bacterium]
MIRRVAPLLEPAIRAIVLALIFLGSLASAQSVQLTPEQQMMLNQLPPAQREQALQVLRQQSAGVQRVGEPVRETAETPSADLSPAVAAEPKGEIQRAGANSHLVINMTPKESLSGGELADLEQNPALSRVAGSRTFVLDDNGVLLLPGIESIPLLGLTESDIELRLGAEPLLAKFDVDARILETEPTGAEALEPFGYDIFEPTEASFDPPMTGPVPPDYALGPGDTVRVQLFGNVNGIYELDVTRDGILNLPEIGPMTVAGLPFSEFRADVNRRVQEMLIGTQVSVTMGQLRTIRVFVLGDANRPGSYVVDSLATISSALYRSGGISRGGSLRDIQLKRSGKVVARLDLYDLLLKGDTSGDSRLQPGDVIFVPSIGPQVSVVGAVNRPAIYETRGKTTVNDVIAMAGGLKADAFPDGARIERIAKGQERIVLSMDADSAEGRAAAVEAGDLLMIPQVLPEFEDVVTLAGHVHRPGAYQWRAGMRLSDLVGSALELKRGADTGYVMVRREDPKDRRVSVVSANLAEALADPASKSNIQLQARDTVNVFSLAFGRQRVIQPILEELQLQSRVGEPYREVSISGYVKAPGIYPLEAGMSINDLIRAGGGLAEEAYTLHAEIARYEIVGGETRSTQVIDIDLDASLRGDVTADLTLEEHDNLRISRVPDWDALATVQLEGEFKFPGAFRIRRGETLRQVLERAGGLTDEAFPEGAVFLREALREREQEQIELLAQRLEADLTSLSLENIDTTGSEVSSTGRSLLAQLRATEAVGRLVIDLEDIAGGGDTRELIGDIELRNGDRLLVPKFSQEVTVIGQTQRNASHLYNPGLTQQDYIDLSGGLTRRADKKLIYVVRASGAIVTNSRSRWLGRGKGVEIRPGDTIVVPLEIDKIRPLELWTSVTQILYQAAIALAAVDSFG